MLAFAVLNKNDCSEIYKLDMWCHGPRDPVSDMSRNLN